MRCHDLSWTAQAHLVRPEPRLLPRCPAHQKSPRKPMWTEGKLRGVGAMFTPQKQTEDCESPQWWTP